MAAAMRLRPATMWVAALIFALALSVLSSPRPDAPPPALFAPTRQAHRVRRTTAPARAKRTGLCAALLLVAEGRKGCGFLEDRPVVVINPEVEHVVRHHPEHHPVAEHAGLAEHTPHCNAAERSELLAQERGKAVAGNHPPSSVLARRSWLLQDSADDAPRQTMLLVSRTVAGTVQNSRIFEGWWLLAPLHSVTGDER